MMKNYIILISIVFAFGYGQYSSIELKFAEMLEDTYSVSLDDNYIGNKKSPLLAMACSGILPGAGEVYMEKWPRAIVFGLIEVFAWTKYFEKQKLGDRYTLDYQLYAQDHWSFAQWTSSYYNWNNVDNEYYEVFSNHETGNYFEIWEDSHHLNFRWGDQQTIVSSSSDTFEGIYTQNGLGNIDSAIAFVESNNVKVEFDHHFYENIGKYDHFYAGWDDSDSIYVETKTNGVQNAFSPHKKYYQQTLRTRANDTYELAEIALKGILANHVVSMLDALILAKLWNNKRGHTISANTYYDYKNPWGVGGVTVSIRW